MMKDEIELEGVQLTYLMKNTLTQLTICNQMNNKSGHEP